jgi:class 3 adenylate cyclase/tetratricopeptide (TPR) repeat protein
VGESRCPACGSANWAGRKFCAECGGPLATITQACTRCGAANGPEERFCGACGASLDVTAGGGAPRVSTPDHLAEKIRRDRPTLEGERKQVTVLFADVKGSMDLAAGLDPEEWAGIMRRFFQALSDGVHRFEGTVDKFTGDGIMALFGAPVAHEDHARRACSAALHLTETVAAYADELRRTKGLSFSARLGLNSGEVVVGGIGDDLAMDYTALGHTVGLAQRMESLAEPGKAYLTEHTARLVSRWFRLQDLGRIEIKGAPAPLGVFVLEGHRLRVGQVVGPGGISPFVGRSAEMAQLGGALARAEVGDAQVVGVVGDAGLGKTRLCDEFAGVCARRGITVRRTAGLSHARTVPLLPVLTLLRDYFGITEADAPRSAREKVAGRLLLLDPAFADSLPLLFDLLEVPDPDRPAPRLSPELRLSRIFEVLKQLTRHRSAQETLVLLWEDLHWLDTQSHGFLDRLIRLYPGTRTLVVANFRPEFHPPWVDEPWYRSLPLAPLPVEAVRQLLAELLGPDASLATLADHVVERTGGNPFFVEEVVRSLIEEGILDGEPRRYHLTRPLAELRVPPTVQATLAARIDRLAPRDKQVLQTAAVVGRAFAEPVVALVASRPDDGEDVALALRALCAGEFLQKEDRGPVAEYRFWHPLTQEVAYGSLLTERRAALHRAVARALVDLEHDRLDELAPLIASHYDRGGEAFEAARWHARSATRTVRSDVDEAMRLWRHSVALLEQLPETEEVLSLAVTALTRLIQFGNRTGLPRTETEALVQRGRELAGRLPNVAPLTGVIQFQGTMNFRFGDIIGARDRYLEAAELADSTDDIPLQACASMSPPVMYAYVCCLPEALRMAERVIDLCAGDVECGTGYAGYSPLISARRSRGELLGLMGRLPEALDELDHAEALARRRVEAEGTAWALLSFARLAFFLGEPRDSVTRAEEAVRLVEESGNKMFQVMATQSLSLAGVVAGQFKRSAAAANRGLEMVQSGWGAYDKSSLLSHLARAELGLESADAARRAADEAVSVAVEQQALPLQVQAYLTRAHVRRRTGGKPEAVLDDVSAGLAAVERSGARAYEPLLLEERGLAVGDRKELRRAQALCATFGAGGHVRRLEVLTV